MGERGMPRGGSLIAGIVMVLIGASLLLNQFDLIDLGSVWDYWPWMFVAWGLFRIVQAESPRRVGGGVTTLLFGVWFLVSETRWNGLSWHNSWPLVFVAIGAGMVTRGVLERIWASGSSAKEVRDERC